MTTHPSEVHLSSPRTSTARADRGVPLARRGGTPRDAVVVVPGRRWADAAIALGALVAGLLVFSWRVGVPSPWRDEAVTIAVASRSAGDVWRLVQHVDLVHAPFYFLAHLLFGSSVTITQARSISVVAAALTGAVLPGLTRRIAGAGVGTGAARLAGAVAAALWVCMPFVSRYAQEARPYALATLLATVSTYLLVRASPASSPTAPASSGSPVPSTPAGRRWWWAAYAVSIPLVVSLNTLAALVVLAHAGWLLGACRRTRVRGVAAVGAGGLLALPLLVAQRAQSEQVAFLRAPTPRELGDHVLFALGSTPGTVVAALAVVVLVWRARARRLVVVGLLWGLLPIPLLWTLSQLTPFWTTRYLVFVAPGTCLLLAAVATVALPGLRRREVPAVLAALLVIGMAVTGLRMQGVFRDPEIGHAEDLRGTAAYVGAHARAGDGLLFVPDGEYRYRVLTQLYPESFDDLDDLALAEPAAASATLVGVQRSAAQVSAAMAASRRVWVVGGPGALVAASPTDAATIAALRRGFRLESVHELRAFTVRLYVAR